MKNPFEENLCDLMFFAACALMLAIVLSCVGCSSPGSGARTQGVDRGYFWSWDTDNTNRVGIVER